MANILDILKSSTEAKPIILESEENGKVSHFKVEGTVAYEVDGVEENFAMLSPYDTETKKSTRDIFVFRVDVETGAIYQDKDFEVAKAVYCKYLAEFQQKAEYKNAKPMKDLDEQY